ncbi:MAG TPA: 4Fe-4S binding protein [Methanosarcina sp.]|nr:4Fe-4S binding protein [Methanosarcina sp.]
MAKAEKKNKKIIQSKKCIGCGICYSVCPVNAKLMKNDDFDPETAEFAIQIVNGMAVIDDEICIRCGTCSKTCPVESLSIVEIESATA